MWLSLAPKFVNANFAGQCLVVLCKALHTMAYHISNTIAADILGKARKNADLDVWYMVEGWWTRFDRFLNQIRFHALNQPIYKHTDEARKRRTSCPLPDLVDLGKLAFRSQVF